MALEENLNNFSGHIPDSIIKDNPNLIKFLKVLDGMNKTRKDEIENFTRSFMFPLVSDIRTMRRYVDGWKAEYTEQSTKICLDCLYRSFFDIYSRKGTRLGLEKLLRCLFWVTEEPVITIAEYTIGKPLILFDDDRPYDWLPEGQDIANEVLASVGEEIWCPTLLDDTWADTKTTITITVDINYVPSATFLAFIRSVIVLYLPMVSRDFIIINLDVI